jgi:hypothetical protein
MRTEIFKEYKSGFLISEQEYRRIVQSGIDSASKLGSSTPFVTSFRAKLSSGSIISTESLDDIFNIENDGPKLIVELSVDIKPTSASEAWSINVTFLNGSKNPKSWVSTSYEIIGTSRDWAFLTASDIEDRIKRCKIFSWEALLSDKLVFPLLMMLAMMVVVFGASLFDHSSQSHIFLQQQVDAGKITDPVKAIIALEKYKNEQKTQYLPIVTMFIVALITFGFPFIAQIFSKPYNFYWGDYIAYYDRLKRRQNILWTVVVLGIIVSIISAYLTKKIGI